MQLLAQMNNQTSTTRTRDAGFVESLLGTYYSEFEGKTDAFCYMDRLVGHDLLVQSLIQVNLPKGKRIEWISDAPKSFKAKRDMITKRSKFKSAPIELEVDPVPPSRLKTAPLKREVAQSRLQNRKKSASTEGEKAQ